MVFLQFPPNLTEEEQMLQNKYVKLKKTKKKLAALKASGGSGGQGKPGGDSDLKLAASGSSSGSRASVMAKKGSSSSSLVPEAKDAKEVAKKLIRTGTIAAIQKSVEKDRSAERFRGFKRSQGLERKLTGLDARAGYQPFSATHGPSGGFDTGGEDMNPEPPEPSPKKVKSLYDSYVSARDREERGLGDREGGGGKTNKPRHTIYVFGYNVTEDILKNTFSANGKIVNVSMEVEKNCGFVTFDKSEAAEQAILDHNGTVVQGIALKVSMARRQPVIEPINDASSSATWSTIAASHSQKGSHKDKRDLVAYDEDVF